MKVIVIGAGAAGMFAAIWAARSGHSVVCLEKNEKAGKKLFITGKGRCNLTNACDNEELFDSIIENPKFMYSALRKFDNKNTIEFFNNLGLKTKIERGNRVFPESDHSSDVIKVLEEEMKRLGVRLFFNTLVQSITTKIDEEGKEVFSSVKTKKGNIEADAVIIATGGVSYPVTGSTGDGHKFAKSLGHKIIPVFPSLVPVILMGGEPKELEGLSLKNVNVAVTDEKKGGKELYSKQGEMLFTRNGVSGPLILTLTSVIGRKVSEGGLKLHIDLKPALDEKKLDERVLRDFEEEKNKNLENAMGGLLPQRLINVVIRRTGIDAAKKVNSISKQEREIIVSVLKDLDFEITGYGTLNEAIITRGGVSIKEINPSTMESKKVKNVYFAGEVMDVDAVTGGFNLQIAWSTAFTAATSIGKTQ